MVMSKDRDDLGLFSVVTPVPRAWSVVGALQIFSESIDEWGRKSGWVGVWMGDGRMDRRMDMWMGGWVDGWTEGWMDG